MKDYKILTDIDLSSNSLYNISKIIGNEYSNVNNKRVSINRSFRDLLITTCDLSNEEAGNTLIRAGISDTPGYVHIWAGVKEEPTYADSNLDNGILIHPDSSIYLTSQSKNIKTLSAIDTTIESKGTINLIVSSSPSVKTTYNSTTIDSLTQDYKVTSTGSTDGIQFKSKLFTIDNEELYTASSKNFNIFSDTPYKSENTPETNILSIKVNENTSKIIVQDIHSSRLSTLLDTKISGDFIFANKFVNGAETPNFNYEKNFTLKGKFFDSEFEGTQLYTLNHPDDVFRLVAFGERKPTIVGEHIDAPKNYSKLTIQHIHVLENINIDGDIVLGSLDKTSNIKIYANDLLVESNNTIERHNKLDVTASDNYHLVSNEDTSILDIGTINAHNNIDIGEEGLSVTGESTFKKPIRLIEGANLIDVKNASNNTLSIDFDKFILKSDTREYIKLEKLNNKGTLNFDNLDFKSAIGKLSILSGVGTGNVNKDTTWAENDVNNLTGDSLLQVESAVIKNENVDTSNIQILNIHKTLNSDGNIDIDSNDINIKSNVIFNIESDGDYNETHNGNYNLNSHSLKINSSSADSFVEANNFIANTDIYSKGSLHVDKDSTLKGDIYLAKNNAEDVFVSSDSNVIFTSKKQFKFRADKGNTQSNFFRVGLDGEDTIYDVATDKFYLHRGPISTTDTDVLYFDGDKAVAHLDELYTKVADFTSITTQDLTVINKIAGAEEVDFTSSKIKLNANIFEVSTTGSNSSYTEDHAGDYTFTAGSLKLGKTDSESFIETDKLTVNTKTTLNKEVDINAAVNIAGKITLDTDSRVNLIEAINSLSVKSDKIELYTLDDKEDPEPDTKNYFTIDKIEGIEVLSNKFKLESGTLGIYYDIENYTGKSHIDVDTIKVANKIDTPNLSTNNLTVDSLTVNNSLITKVESNLTFAAQTVGITSSDLSLISTKVFDFNAYNDALVINVNDEDGTTNTIDFKGNTTLTGNLNVNDGDITLVSGNTLNVSSIKNNKDSNLNIVSDKSIAIVSNTNTENISFTPDNNTLYLESENLISKQTAADIKIGTKDKEEFTLNVSTAGGVTKSDLKSTNINVTNLLDVDTKTITKDLKVENTANFNNFTIYWDTTTSSLVFARGNL